MDLPLSSLEPLSSPPTPRAVSKQCDRRVARAVAVYDRSCLERGDLGYYSSIFTITNLPHRDPGPDTTCWTRRNGHACLVVRPGLIPGQDGTLISVGIPYGMWPRLLVLYLSTEAVRTQSPRIELGSSLSDFFGRLKIAPDTRRVQMLRRQALRLFSASIQFTFANSELMAGGSAQVAAQYLLWHSTNDDNPRPHDVSHVILTSRFFRDLLDHPYPVDIGAVQGLRQSPLALDLYLWLPHRLRALKAPRTLLYDDLAKQLGSQYFKIGEFARHCRHALRLVQLFWYPLRYQEVLGGIRFFPSDLPVPIRTNPAKTKIR
jgi:hypothetical protein